MRVNIHGIIFTLFGFRLIFFLIYTFGTYEKSLNRVYINFLICIYIYIYSILLKIVLISRDVIAKANVLLER